MTNPDRCNLRCALCFLNQRGRAFSKGEMPWNVAEKAVRFYAAKGIGEVIPSTMGEPLLYSHFEQLESLVRELGIRLNLTTNGTFPGKGAEAWAKELLPISKDIKISCWGMKKRSLEKLCPGMDGERFRENVSAFVRMRQKILESSELPLSKISLQMAVCKTNRDDVERVVEWAAELGIDRVKLNRAVFLSGSESLQKMEQISPEDFGDYPKLKNVPVELGGTFLQSPRKKDSCPFLERELWILPDGSVEFCPDPENRFVGIPPGKSRCEICHLFPQNSFCRR